MLRILPAAALAFALLVPAARADVVATTAKPTPLAAADGKVLYSAWDGSQYRLTELNGAELDDRRLEEAVRRRPRQGTRRPHGRRLRP